MTSNVGTPDRIVRIVIALAALVGAFAVGFGSVWAWVLVVVAAIMAVTAVVGMCPIYRIFKISTRRASA